MTSEIFSELRNFHIDVSNHFFRRAKMTTIPKDPVILLSFINTKLRDHYSSLDALCGDLGLSENEITSKLSAIDYQYDQSRNQFV